jgi:hypothetical protein
MRDPEHAAHEMAHWFTLGAEYRERLSAQCDEEIDEFFLGGGTVEDLKEKAHANH